MMRMEAAEETRKIISEAMEQARHVTKQAQEQGYAEGLKKGYDEGYASGMADAREEREQYRREVELFVERIELERQRLWAEAEPQFLQFVLEIAQKVVKDDAKINPEIALSVIKNSLRRIVDTGSIRIRVNGADLDAARNAREDLISLVDGMRHLEIVEDRRVSAGGCIVETSSGNIDARIETQFAEINHLLDPKESA